MNKFIIVSVLTVMVISGCGFEKTLEDENKVKNDTSQEEKHNSEKVLINVKVLEVVDGDTIKVELSSKKETIRLLLIDTPETKHPRLGKQPFGEEASEFAKKVMPINSEVFLEFDVSGMSRDKYGRLLAYVWLDEKKLYNEEVIGKGLARVAYVYPPNTKYVDRLNEVQEKAQKEGLGIWSIEDYVQEKVYQNNESFEKEDEKDSLKYDPYGKDRDCGDFATQKDAQNFFEAAGGPKKDLHRLDGSDRDGIVCESLPN